MTTTFGREFRCPRCGGRYFGRDTTREPETGKGIVLDTVRCHDEHGTGCKWRGAWSECGDDTGEERKMSVRQDIAAELDQAEYHGFFFGDGLAAGAEFSWMQQFDCWVWFDGESGKTGSAEELTFISSAQDGDESCLNSMEGLIAADLSGDRGVWVFAGHRGSGDLPEDAEVYILGDPQFGMPPRYR